MPRARIVVLLGLSIGIAAWLAYRPSPTAAAAQPSEETTVSYGENTEEVALHRWESGQARHWRQAVTRR
jgi:hypothetical protein